MKRIGATIVIAALVSGCAQMPPIDFSYYPSRGDTAITVTRTFDCSTDGKRLVTVTTPPTVTTLYTADHGQAPIPLEISRTRGDLSDTDFTINYYEDGRLKSINAQSTGQAEAALKSAISLVGAILPLVGGAGDTGAAAPKLPQCDVIANWGKGKPVTLTYSGTIDLAASGPAPVNLTVSVDGESLARDLNVPAPQALLTVRATPIVPAVLKGDGSINYVPLKLQKVYPATIAVMISGSKVFTGNVLVPKPETYDLPIPKAQLFGKTTVVINVAESGAVTSIQYAKTAGAAGALNVLGAAATEAAPDSAATKAAALKAQADMIAQAQRLARCQAQPDQCQ